jgi:dihydroorotate dehydrogenase electron transfer subunit
MFQIRAKLNFNKMVKGGYFHLLLKAPQIAKQAQPGQFVDIRISGGCEPLLRRPFSIHRVDAAKIEILYEVVGKSTEILSQRKTGEYLDIIGPLGNVFDYRTSYIVHRTSILVAGGMGVAPLFFLAEQLVKRTTHGARRMAQVLIGTKTKKQILCEKEFQKLGCGVKIATDDGSKGFKGKVTELLKQVLVARRTPHAARLKLNKRDTCDVERGTIIYACGPRPMLKEIANISKKYNIPAQISLEEHMACGIGACLGCVIKTQYAIRNTQYAFQYKRVCKEGPVFAADEIAWE